MTLPDVSQYAWTALRGYRWRTLLMLIAMAIGVAAVVVLTSLGEGARRYVTGEFAALGTHLLIVVPGRTETGGASPTTFVGETPRDLTLDDARAIERSRSVHQIAPVVLGSAPASWGGREREVPILGTTYTFVEIRRWEMAQGRFLPPGPMDQARPVCVIGSKVRDELFGAHRALGEWIRIGDSRFRVIGVLASEGHSIGLDTQELVFVPVASAQSLFNTSSLFRIFVEAPDRDAMERARTFIIDTLRARHQGEEDVTVITQDAVLATFDKIFRALTLTVAGIAAISLAVAGILIMNVMLVAVAQRTTEIGLLKAMGAPARQIQYLFLAEAGILSLTGAGVGLFIGKIGSLVIGWLFPALEMGAPWWAVIAALATAIGAGLLFGVLPARRAARLDPVLALSRR